MDSELEFLLTDFSQITVLYDKVPMGQFGHTDLVPMTFPQCIEFNLLQSILLIHISVS